MSQPQSAGHGPKSPPDPTDALHVLATSPGWAKGPNEWLHTSNIEEDHIESPIRGSGSYLNQSHHDNYLDDDDILQMSSELKGSDLEQSDYLDPRHWDKVYSADERERRSGLAAIGKSLRFSLANNSPTADQVVPRLTRLLYECPFSDVQEVIKDLFNSLSKELEAAGLSVPPNEPRASRFFKGCVIPITTSLEPQASLFKESFLTTGRVTHLTRILAWHPTYLERFSSTYNFVMRAEGPLPYHFRHYIAIIASARFKCHYLVKQQQEEFLLCGGEADWLDSVDNLPPKIFKLLEINSLLAHKPWLVQSKHIADLVSSGDAFSRWSMSELVHALVIMATFRGLSGLALGMGINPELDVSLSPKSKRDSSSSLRGSATGRSGSIDNESDVSDRTDSSSEQLAIKLASASGYDDMCDAEERKKLFEAAGDSNLYEGEASAEDWGAFAKYIGPFPMMHQDFDVRSRDYSVFHIQDYTWEEQAYELLQRHYDCAHLLDEEFNTIFDLTYRQVNDQKDVDTTPFRRSVWYYVHRIQGVLHDDYNYANVNGLLPRNMKKFVKDLSCTPYTITGQDLVNLGYTLLSEEKCHIALLATEARKQAELVYALRAITRQLGGN